MTPWMPLPFSRSSRLTLINTFMLVALDERSDRLNSLAHTRHIWLWSSFIRQKQEKQVLWPHDLNRHDSRSRSFRFTRHDEQRNSDTERLISFTAFDTISFLLLHTLSSDLSFTWYAPIFSLSQYIYLLLLSWQFSLSIDFFLFCLFIYSFAIYSALWTAFIEL